MFITTATHTSYRGIWGLPATLAKAVILGSLFRLQKMRLCMFQLLTVSLMHILLNLLFVPGLRGGRGSLGISLCGMGQIRFNGCDYSATISADDT